MKLGKMLLVATALAVHWAAGAAAQSLEIGLTRFYRSAGGQTVVDGFARIPFTALDTLTRGPNGVAAYRVAISVRDSANLQLVEQSWTRSLPARMLATARGSALEHFMFAASPGTYTVEVTVHDSASGRVTREQVPLTAFAVRPAASDLLLATAMRAAVSGDTTLAAGELRKGSAIVQAAVRPLLTPQQAQLGYYLEWYGGGRVGQAAETAAVSVRILRADGTPVVATPAQQVPFGLGGGVTRAMIDLAGLPAGEYGFEVVVQGRDTTAARRAPFRGASGRSGTPPRGRRPTSCWPRSTAGSAKRTAATARGAPPRSRGGGRIGDGFSSSMGRRRKSCSGRRRATRCRTKSGSIRRDGCSSTCSWT